MASKHTSLTGSSPSGQFMCLLILGWKIQSCGGYERKGGFACVWECLECDSEWWNAKKGDSVEPGDALLWIRLGKPKPDQEKTNFPEYHGQEKIVIRRYSDFVWLRDRLSEKYKGIFIPPLPEKSAVEKFRFSAEFIEMRRQGLDIFVNRIASHPALQQSDDLRTFLQEDEDTMERFRSQETGIFKKKPADLMQIFKNLFPEDVQSKVSDVVLGKEKPVEESNPEYEKLKHYVFELEDHLAEAQKQAFRLVKRHRACNKMLQKNYTKTEKGRISAKLGQSLSDFGKAVKLLGACEGNSLGKAFSDLGNKSEILSMKLQKEAYNLLMNFEEPLKDYVRAVQSIKATMADRANAFRQQCELAETTRLKEINLDRLMLMRSDKAGEAEIEYTELKAASEEATQRFETIVKLMNEEIVRFQDQKTSDIGVAFHEFAKGQAQLSNDIADAWRSLLPKLEAISTHTNVIVDANPSLKREVDLGCIVIIHPRDLKSVPDFCAVQHDSKQLVFTGLTGEDPILKCHMLTPLTIHSKISFLNSFFKVLPTCVTLGFSSQVFKSLLLNSSVSKNCKAPSVALANDQAPEAIQSERYPDDALCLYLSFRWFRP
ncbi:Sorting nexin-1 [Asimina triloba]